MTKQTLSENRDAVIAKYYELGGLENLLRDFMKVLVEAAEFGLNETENPLDLVSQFFSPKWAGKKEKKDSLLREAMGKSELRNLDAGLVWNPIHSTWEKPRY